MNEAGMIRWKLKDRVIAQDKEIAKLQAQVERLEAENIVLNNYLTGIRNLVKLALSKESE